MTTTQRFHQAADHLSAALDAVADLVESEQAMASLPTGELDQFAANLREAQDRVDGFLGYMPGPRIEFE